ncbi:uncharacterized protein LOC126672298 [Mercurialis annua]|uniref:uncharacterized protein LOC126672298 n=1 Tax=Mercurialis annua TaxID=3986 RepID=UPI002160CCBF|nr:uncharacterized protein LOC126672298 [Mercurialis annua]
MAGKRSTVLMNVGESSKKVILTEEEEEEIILEDEIESEFTAQARLGLTGKLVTKVINVEAMRRTFNSIWKLNKGFGIKQWPNNVFVFQFYNMRDKERVIKGSPWTFDNSLLVLKDVDMEESPDNIVFDKVPFWIRILNVPIGRMTKSMASTIGGRLGTLIEVDEDRLGGWSRYIRVRVDIDIEKPLKRGVTVRLNANQKKWLEVQYERLGSFCYVCGRLGHQDIDCEEGGEVLDKSLYQYGEELRASPLKSISRSQKIDKEKEDSLIKEINKKLHFGNEGAGKERVAEISQENGGDNERHKEREEQVNNSDPKSNVIGSQGEEQPTNNTKGKEQVVQNKGEILPSINSQQLMHGTVHENECLSITQERELAALAINLTREEHEKSVTAKNQGKNTWKRAARQKSEEDRSSGVSSSKRAGAKNPRDEVVGMEIDSGILTKKQKDSLNLANLLISADSDEVRVRWEQ